MASAAVLAALFGPVAASAVEDEVRSLLRHLWIQVPSPAVTAPSFSLADLNGTPVHLADYKGRLVMLYFWTTY